MPLFNAMPSFCKTHLLSAETEVRTLVLWLQIEHQSGEQRH
jgi:hypothetical protein